MSQAASCPICSKNTAKDYAPFCSKRCADVDLNRWLSDQYAVAGGDDESAEVHTEDEALRH